MKKQYIYYSIVLIILIIVGFWGFNHINPWISIGYFILLGIIVMELIIKKIKK